MVTIFRHCTYENYLVLRRQLGQAINSDRPEYEWNEEHPLNQQMIIDQMYYKCQGLIKNRDLSWGNYCSFSPSESRVYKTAEQWEATPLFIKAAIIKPHGDGDSMFADEALYSEPVDRPESEVTPW
jgi:hypothetical protein